MTKRALKPSATRFSLSAQYINGTRTTKINVNCWNRKVKNTSAADMPWFLYLIECKDGSIYTGITVDVQARYATHEKGRGAKYTRSHPPRRLLAVFTYTDRASASRAEYQMKRLSKATKRGICLQRDALWKLPRPAQSSTN